MTESVEIYSGISSVAHRFKGILLDAYGVFWGGNEFGLLPGAKETMEQLVSAGKIVGILSNATQLVSKEVDKLQSHGLIQGKHFHFLITSGEVTKELFTNRTLPFKTPRNTFWLFGGVHPKYSSHEAIFQDTSYKEVSEITDADFIYISIPHIDGEDQVDPEKFRAALEAIKVYRVPMVCANPDRFAHEGKPPMAFVRQGSIAKMYEEMGGQVFYIGKPGGSVYSSAMGYFRRYKISDPQQILMVGDTPETDIRGARNFGMPSALLMKTGMMAERISHNGLEKALKALQDQPTYFLGQLADEFYSSSQSS
ncbi:MAG: TIGR01459 family HAD-type hydrolase [Parachlamydiaceae bacterium]|nr:TIGR01459 family HAD-type hydrolase [Parachlamydiaceae bacterium]